MKHLFTLAVCGALLIMIESEVKGSQASNPPDESQYQIAYGLPAFSPELPVVPSVSVSGFTPGPFTAEALAEGFTVEQYRPPGSFA
jgi:hypothetical protein